jgi:uncharacterized protein
MAGGRRRHHHQLTGLPYAADGDGVRLHVRITPRAKRNGFAGLVVGTGGRPALAVRLEAPPVEGAANDALTRLLADAFGVSRSSLRIASGEKSRLKIVRFTGLTPDAFAHRLAALLAP